MGKSVFIFIESNTSGTGQVFAATAARLGFEPILLAAEPQRYHYVQEDGINCIQIETRNHAALLSCLALLSCKRHIAGIYSSSEYFVEISARAATNYGLASALPDAIQLCRRKHMQRQKLKLSGIGVPNFVCISTISELQAALDSIGLPVIIKPTMGSGSVGVRLCQSAEEANSHANKLLNQTVNERGVPQSAEVLVEELASGPEYSVEVFNSSVIGLCAKHLSAQPFFVETGHDFPAALGEVTLGEISRLALRAVRACGLVWGPAHVEIRNTHRGPVIIEVNPRLAGGFIPELIRLATGVDLIQATLELSAGLPATLQKTSAKYASIRFIMCTGDGVLKAVDGFDMQAGAPNVADVRLYRKIGDRVEICHDFRDRIGHVISCADTQDAAKEAASAVRDRIRVDIAPADVFERFAWTSCANGAATR